MRWPFAVLMLAALTLNGQTAWAQDDRDTRQATPTFLGDTGLWFVPTAEVVRPKGVSVSVYRTEMDYNQGFTDVSFFPVTAAVGIGSRVEVFGNLRAVNRIDRDMRPLFLATDSESGGAVNGYPFVRDPWSGNKVGDLYIGGKFNLLSQSRQAPVALAVRATFKFPTADADTGAGTGELDTFWDAVVSKEFNNRIEFTGYGGLAMRGDPDDVDISDSFRWGIGAGFGTRSNFRFTAELFGESPFDDVVFQNPLVATDGSVAPLLSEVGSNVNTLLGVTWQHSNGLMLGAALTYRMGLRGREEANPAFSSNSGDAVGVQFRVGFHPGVKVYVPPPPPPPPTAKPAPPPPVVAAPPPPPAPAPPPPNRPPTVTVQCDPCTIPVGGTVSIRATGQDPDGDTLTYVWSAPGGTIGNTRAATTTWRAETVPGATVVTVTVTDGRGGQVTGTTTIQVVAVQPPALGPILFDFDQSVLRPEAIAVLDEMFKFLTANPTRSLRIEGHASAEGTPEYNQALSERRTQAVRANLQGRGIDAARLAGQSFGETRPRNPNDTEANRRLNRRAELFVQ